MSLRYPRPTTLLLSLLTACGAPDMMDIGPRVPSALSETQAHLVIDLALTSANEASAGGLRAELEEVGTLELDFAFGEPAFGIEWLSTADRKGKGAALPRSEGGDPLRVVLGTIDGAPTQVVVIDAQAYLYESNPRWVQRGAPGIEDAEDRLRTDVNNFLEYTRGLDPPLSN